MSIETDYRALLAGYAPLATLVGTRIAQSAVADAAGFPCVVFDARLEPIYASDALLGYRAQLDTQCWAETSAAAAAVADAVVAAIGTAPAANAVRLIDRATTYDAEFGADGVALSVEWWA